MLQALLAGGLSLLSGLGAQSSAKSQQKRQAAYDEAARQYNEMWTRATNEKKEALGRELLTIPHTVDELESSRSSYDIDRFRADGEKLGYNPVTWLRSGALSGYGLTDTASSKYETGQNAAAAFALMVPDTPTTTATQAVKVPSTMQAIGDAGTAALNVYRADEKQAASQAFQTTLLEKQLAAIGAGKQNGSFFSGTGAPTIGSAGTAMVGGLAGSRRSSGARGGGTLSSGSSDPLDKYDPKAEEAQFTNPWSWKGSTIDTQSPDAQSYEDRYGNIIAEIAGGYNLASDSLKNQTGKSIPQWVTMGYDRLNAAFPAGSKQLPANAGVSDYFSYVTRNVPNYGDYFRPQPDLTSGMPQP